MYDADQARRELLDAIAEATDRIGVALGAVGDAYEQLDEVNADRLESALFRPLQAAYGRIRRTHAGFAERHGLPGRVFEPAPAAAGGRGVRELVDRAVASAAAAEAQLAALQDSMMPVEVGDAELRDGLADVRRRLAGLTVAAHGFVRGLGR